MLKRKGDSYIFTWKGVSERFEHLKTVKLPILYRVTSKLNVKKKYSLNSYKNTNSW